MSLTTELFKQSLFHPLYDITKQLDGTRPTIATDGVSAADCGSDLVDFCSQFYDTGAAFPLEGGHYMSDSAFEMKSAPMKPTISHEDGNFNTFPRLNSQIAKLESSAYAVHPWWLTPAKTLMEEKGWLAENDVWSRNSERLYVETRKLWIESLRLQPWMSGFEWWLCKSTASSLASQRPSPGSDRACCPQSRTTGQPATGFSTLLSRPSPASTRPPSGATSRRTSFSSAASTSASPPTTRLASRCY